MGLITGAKRVVTVTSVVMASVLSVSAAAVADEPEPALVAGTCVATGSETIATDREVYQPEETVVMDGNGYAGDCDVVVRVTRPDESVVIGDGTFTPGSDTVAIPTDGSLAYQYVLDGITGTYLVDVIGADGAILASTSFEDPSVQLWSDSGFLTMAGIFRRGDTVYAKFDVALLIGPPQYAKFFVLNPSGTIVQTTACLLASSFVSTGSRPTDSYLIGPTDPLSSASAWTYRMSRYGNDSSCNTLIGGTHTFNTPFYVAQAFAFALQTERDACIAEPCANVKTTFTPGEIAWVKVLGVKPSISNMFVQWTKPNSTTTPLFNLCRNSSGADNPDSDANGGVGTGYPPASVGEIPDVSPAGVASCGAIVAAEAGIWKIRLNVAANHSVELSPFSVVTNTAPTISTLQQFKSDGTAAIAVGGVTTETQVKLKAALADANNDNVTLQVELQPVGTAFTNAATHTSGPAAPGTFTVNPTGLDPTNAQTGTGYHWQARACDALVCSSWVSFPESATNAETAADFIVDRTAPDVTITDTDTCDGTTCDGNQTIQPAEDNATVTWNANEDGTYKVVLGTDCTVAVPTGTLTDNVSGTYDEPGDGDVTSTIDKSALAYGENTITVCVTDAPGNTGSEDTTVWEQVPTSLTYNPPSSPPTADSGPVVVPLSATLAKTVTSTECLVGGKTIEFFVDGVSQGTAVTTIGGLATLNGESFGPGIYDIRVEFDGTTEEDADADNCAAAVDEGVLTVITTGDAANGGGWYQLSGQTGPWKRVSFGFTTRWDPRASAYKGQILVINSQKWRLKGQVTAYAKTSTGNGELYVAANLFAWDVGTATWATTGVPVTFRVKIYDAGLPSKKTPTKTDAFTVTWVKNSSGVTMTTVTPLVQSALQYLKGGNIQIS